MMIPRLRPGLDIFPSPWPDRPGLVLRDPFLYSEEMLLIAPETLPFFDGTHSEHDMQEQLEAPLETIHTFVEALRSQGFLATDEFLALRDARQAEFRDAPVRERVHTDGNYPREMLDHHLSLSPLTPNPQPLSPVVGLAAPHVSPEGGWQSYAAAYRRITSDLADRTFVILGTSHYGEPEKFGLTRKPFATQWGTTEAQPRMIDKLVQRASRAIIEEDYCHAFEHTIEFQVLFLQHLMGDRPVKVLPILCGQFADSLATGRPPESPMFDALGELAAEYGDRLFWIMGVDMAHMGARYEDSFTAHANRGVMQEVAARDQARLARVCAGDAAGFADLVTPNGDDLKWCGYSPLYTFLRALPNARGRVLSYEQWNIDPQSVVSFAGMEFGGTSSEKTR